MPASIICVGLYNLTFQSGKTEHKHFSIILDEKAGNPRAEEKIMIKVVSSTTNIVPFLDIAYILCIALTKTLLNPNNFYFLLLFLNQILNEIAFL
jgi:hypothetical protein